MVEVVGGRQAGYLARARNKSKPTLREERYQENGRVM